MWGWTGITWFKNRDALVESFAMLIGKFFKSPYNLSFSSPKLLFLLRIKELEKWDEKSIFECLDHWELLQLNFASDRFGNIWCKRLTDFDSLSRALMKVLKIPNLMRRGGRRILSVGTRGLYCMFWKPAVYACRNGQFEVSYWSFPPSHCLVE